MTYFTLSKDQGAFDINTYNRKTNNHLRHLKLINEYLGEYKYPAVPLILSNRVESTVCPRSLDRFIYSNLLGHKMGQD